MIKPFRNGRTIIQKLRTCLHRMLRIMSCDTAQICPHPYVETSSDQQEESTMDKWNELMRQPYYSPELLMQINDGMALRSGLCRI